MGMEKRGLMCLCFHAISPSKDTQRRFGLLPALCLTLLEYRQIFEHFLEAGYVFVSERSICEGLSDGGRYVHITFDDGYFNNVNILPLLKEYEIPVHIFVATSNVLLNRKYWWDVVYDRMQLAGKNGKEISDLIEKLKKEDHRKIVEYVVKLFGVDSFNPVSDFDRPLTPIELLELAGDPLITIGNHTRDHIIMDQVNEGLALEQVVGAQQDLKGIIGYEPLSFAFPNGNYNDKSLNLLGDIGFQFGFSSDFRLNRLRRDLEGKRRFKLGRYNFISSLDLEMQCQMFRAADFAPIVVVKRLQKLASRLTN
jgi:peptidoglycan/xylan/chitin deacetylase (PgdA/CDA1 family)